MSGLEREEWEYIPGNPEPEIEIDEGPKEPIIETVVVNLSGRYYATLSIVPYLFLAVLLFFAASFILTFIFLKDAGASFQLVILPFMAGCALLSPLLAVFLFIIRWHGKRRLEMDDHGVTMVLPNEQEVYIPWEFLVAVELRFAQPKLVQCTLVSPAMRFTFSTLEYNLKRRLALHNVFKAGFELDAFREFLYYLHRKAPKTSWRTSMSFKERFKIFYPPYDLEKLKW